MPDKHPTKLDRIGGNPSFTIGTLAAKTGVLGLKHVITQNFQASLYQGVFDFRGATLGEAVLFGVAGGDLTLTEIEACIESVPLMSRSTTEIEASRRNVQILAMLSLDRPILIDKGNRLPMYRENVGIQFFAYNASSAAMTTGGVLSGNIWTYGRWKD